jgi:predicted Zn finger-like uncharacterized protein
MNVYCSHCSTGYLLPDDLLGPRGARVRCPACGKTFVVLLETAPSSGDPGTAGDVAPTPLAAERVEPEPAAAGEPRAPMAAPEEPAGDGGSPQRDETLAHQLLDGLAREKGARLERARLDGRVLAEFGPELMSVYEEYRRRLGSAGSPHTFKRVLKELWAVDLITGVEG